MRRARSSSTMTQRGQPSHCTELPRTVLSTKASIRNSALGITTYPVRGAEASRDAFAVCTGYVVLPSAGYRVLFFLLLLVSVDVYPCSHRHILVQPLAVLVPQPHAPVRHGRADRSRVMRAVPQLGVG